MRNIKGWIHWCPDGCGKKVVFIGQKKLNQNKYQCKKCLKLFNKEDLK